MQHLRKVKQRNVLSFTIPKFFASFLLAINIHDNKQGELEKMSFLQHLKVTSLLVWQLYYKNQAAIYKKFSRFPVLLIQRWIIIDNTEIKRMHFVSVTSKSKDDSV